MKVKLFLISFILCVAVMGYSQSTPMLSYQGMVTHNGTNYTGTGYFKFALENGDSSERYWSNDGTPVGEPSMDVMISVQDGLFNVMLGDTNAPMNSLPPIVFQQSEFWLRTWFSPDGLPSPSNDLGTVYFRPESFSTINTEDLIVVDPNGSGDFIDVQTAVDFVETNSFGPQVILLMPGIHTVYSPLIFPEGTSIILQGVSKDQSILSNPGGAVLMVGDGRLDSLTLEGSPALIDGPGASKVLEVNNCIVRESSGSGPAISLSSSGTNEVCLFNTEVDYTGSNGGIDLSGDVEFLARECSISADSPWVVTISGAARCEFSDTEFEGGNAALYMNSVMANSTFKDCVFYSGIDLYGLQANVEFTGCEIRNSWMSTGQVTVQDSSWVTFRDCQLRSFDAPALAVTANSGTNTSVYLNGCDVFMDGSSPTYVITLSNDSGNDVEDVELSLNGTEVAGWWPGQMGAISASNSKISAGNSSVESSGEGIYLTGNSILEMTHSDAEGETGGIHAVGPSKLELDMCMVNGGDEMNGAPAVWAEGDVTTLIVNSDLSGDGGDANAIGLKLDDAGGFAPYVNVLGTLMFGDYRGILASGNSIIRATGSTVISEMNIPAEFQEYGGITPSVLFASSTFTRLVPASQPAILLSGANATAPSIINCNIQAPGHFECFGLSGPLSANINMANSILSTNVGTSITINAPTGALTNGNYIIP